MANIKVTPSRMTSTGVAVSKQLTGQTAEDMLVKKMAQNGTTIKPMDQKIIFDFRVLTADVGGVIRGPLIFFGNARSGHPLGIYATNMGRDGAVENNKCWLIKDIGINYLIQNWPVAITPENKSLFTQMIGEAMPAWNLSTKDPNDRDLVRGTLMHYPNGGIWSRKTNRLDDPAAVAIYTAQEEDYNPGDNLHRNRLNINWFLNEGQQFHVAIDGNPITLGADGAEIDVLVIADMTVTEFTRVN